MPSALRVLSIHTRAEIAPPSGTKDLAAYHAQADAVRYFLGDADDSADMRSSLVPIFLGASWRSMGITQRAKL